MYGNQIFSIAKPCNNQKHLIVNATMTENLWSPFSVVTEIIQSPSNSDRLSNGNQIFLVTIQHTPTIKWRLKSFGH
jgi:hypothetical protein